tara:strand:+ start:93 stop:425 length:333 start_codon:yes stop_codon:yes gene_type:complete
MKKLLKERFQKLAGIREEEEEIKTITGLANAFRDVSIGLRKGEYKGIQGAEITEIKILLDLVLQAAIDTNITTVIKRLETMVGKSIKDKSDEPVSSKSSEPMGDIEDETI